MSYVRLTPDKLPYHLRRSRSKHPEGSRIDLTTQGGYIFVGTDRRRADWVGLGRQPALLVDVPAIAIEPISANPVDGPNLPETPGGRR